MDYTKKIMYQSNYWYNDGLRKAQIRDLSGAAASLRRSLQYNRGNIAARNLLGLVYYGAGEVAEALVEWIISKNLRPIDNIANDYVQNVQDSARQLEKVNQALKKYNQCLEYCSRGGEDLAVIQLKQVIADHPSFVRAHQLLALLYLQNGQYGKAKPILRVARKLDTANETTLRYIHEVASHKGGKKKRNGRKSRSSAEYGRGNDLIIQPVHHLFQRVSEGLALANMVMGIAIGAAVVWFLIVPAVNQAKSSSDNRQSIEYAEQLNAMKAQISAQTRTLDEYRASSADTEAAQQTAAGTSDSYENLLTASQQYSSGNYTSENIADTLLNVNRSALGSSGQAMYDDLSSSVFETACQVKYDNGIASLNVANYDTAIDNLLKVVKMNESYDDGGALLNLGIAYLRKGDNDSATNYLKKVIEKYPGTDYATEAQTNLDSIQSQSAQ